MDFIVTLWLPIVLSAVFVFIVSSVIHMFLGYHASDFRQVPQEDRVMDAMRQFNIPPGDYITPKASSMQEMRSEAFQEKAKKGPVMYLTVRTSDFGMGKSLVQWFFYCIVLSIFAGYIGINAVGPGADYLDVFRFVGTSAFMGYALAFFQDPIWMSRSWTTTFKSAFDGLVYAVVTAGTFGWLWPGA